MSCYRLNKSFCCMKHKPVQDRKLVTIPCLICWCYIITLPHYVNHIIWVFQIFLRKFLQWFLTYVFIFAEFDLPNTIVSVFWVNFWWYTEVGLWKYLKYRELISSLDSKSFHRHLITAEHKNHCKNFHKRSRTTPIRWLT